MFRTNVQFTALEPHKCTFTTNVARRVVAAFVPSPSRRLLLLAAVLLLATGPAASARLVFVGSACTRDNPPVAFPGPPGGTPSCDPEIFTSTDAGQDVRQLTANATNDDSPAWSPLGDRVAWLSDDPDRSFSADLDIFVMNADGTGQHRVLPKHTFDRVGAPRWSKDGLRLVFSGTYWNTPGHTAGTHIYTVSPDGSGLRQLTDGPTEDDAPDFSPDGLRIVFVRHAAPSGGLPLTGVANLWTMLPDGSDQHPLTTGDLPYALWNVRFSPLGDQLAISTASRIWTVPASGGVLRAVTPPVGGGGDESASGATWASLDSSRLIYSRLANPTQDPYAPVHGDLWSLVIASGARTRITDSAAGHEDVSSSFIEPDWTFGPDSVVAPVIDDVTAPVVTVIGGVLGGLPLPQARAAGRARAVSVARASDLHLLAMDRSGIRGVRVSVNRRAGPRCRPLTTRGFAAARACRRLVFLSATTAAEWRKVTGRLRRGGYDLQFRTGDVKGNHSRRNQRFAVRIRG